MNALKRSLLYITRKKRRTILLLIILTVISTLVLSGLSILRASTNSGDKLRESTGSGFTISQNFETATKIPTSDPNTFTYDQEFIKSKMIKKISEIEGIKDYNAKYANSATIQDLNKKNLDLIVYTDIFNDPILKSTSTIFGGINTKYDSYFTSNKFQLAKGRHITKDDKNKVLVSSEFAKKYDFKVGDKFKFALTKELVEAENSFGGKQIKANDLDVEIVGIFNILEEQPDKDTLSQAELYENRIFSDISSINELYSKSSDTAKNTLDPDFSEADFFVKDPKKLESIMKEVKNISSINWKNFNLVANDKVYKASSNSISNIDKLITTMIIIVVIISLVIVTLILSMWTRSRLRETGILISVGVSKFNILIQYILETLFITIFAFLLSYFISTIATKYIVTIMDTVLTPDDTKVTFNSFILVFSFGIISVLASIGISIIPAMKINPKEILSKMS